eukprot:TRINITY_DN31736_c0_g1_i1.p1 TRINITY_DN31736_c0_g1~~TRINITY_DN31736_c0_g1_i1.p1  ORF type:complete len:159 (+),score=34.74 TRINITY_DN31736_c0_g1_i1:132-608(+)
MAWRRVFSGFNVGPTMTQLAKSSLLGQTQLPSLSLLSKNADAFGNNAGILSFIPRRWATKKAAGYTQNGRDSRPKYLGVKKFGGEKVIPGNIIVRQRGKRFHPGDYVGMGKDHTLFALKEGHVKFRRNKQGKKLVNVVPIEGHVLHPIYQKTNALKEA